MASANGVIPQCLYHLDRSKRTQIAIEVAAVRHRIDMRSECDWLERGNRASSEGPDVSGRIDLRLQAGGAQQSKNVTPTGHVGVRVGDTTDTGREGSAHRPSESAQLLERMLQAFSVDSQLVHLSARAPLSEPPCADQRAGKSRNECASIADRPHGCPGVQLEPPHHTLSWVTAARARQHPRS